MQVIEGVEVMHRLSDVVAEVNRLRGSGVDVAYDIETTSVDPINSKMVAVQFKPRGRRASIIDVRNFTKDELRTLGSILEPLFDGEITLVGHNLKFDLEFALAQMGIGAKRVYDTMLAEQIIYGLGMSSATDQGISFGMGDLAKRYELPVSKEERSWFIDLDTRLEGGVLSVVGSHIVHTDGYVDEDGEWVEAEDVEVEDVEMVGGYKPWDLPFPEEQIRYMRQDVSIVHRIKEIQQAAIEEYKLHEVLDIEMRMVLALVGIEVWGVTINREGWLSVIDRVAAIAKKLEEKLHLGIEGQFDGLDVHILKVRKEKYWEKWHPYHDWMVARNAYEATLKPRWEEFHATEELQIPKWGEYKKAMMASWYETHGKTTKPPESKAGVNLGSWMQVRDGFNSLGIAVKSVNEETLTPYIGKHPLVQVYIDYSHARKIETVYGRERGKKKRAFIELLDSYNRLRASYQQIGADTGRMSSFNPNFQQIPSDGVGAELRQHVVAAAGYTFVVADFSNIELRILAELSGDEFLLGAFSAGVDVHSYTAGVMFGLESDQINKDWTDSHDAVVGGKTLTNTSYRKIAKTINYMLLYGAGPTKLAAKLQIEVSAAKQLMGLYYKAFEVAIGWLNKQKKRLDIAMNRDDERVFSKTRAGRRRWFTIPKPPRNPASGKRVTVEAMEKYDEDLSDWRGRLAGIKRQLANTPIQGLSADITKLAAAFWYEEVGYNENMKLVAIIHDEMIIESVPALAKTAAKLLEDCMMRAMRQYLKVVELGDIHAVQTPYWMH